MPPRLRVLAVAVAMAAVATGAWARARAARALPPDYDEFAYLPAAFLYAERMAPGRWAEIPAVRDNPEHPPLVKLLFAADLRLRGVAEPDWRSVRVGRPIPEAARPAFAGARALSAAAGTLQVAALALAAPLGAPWAALDTYQVKYTAQAYVEAVPGLFAVLALLLLERALRRREGLAAPPPLPLLASAACLGLACAGKYPYALVTGLAILPFLLLRTPRRSAALYVAAALATFLACDPALWPDPAGRLWDSVAFHWRYTQTDHVRRSALPWTQQLHYLTTAEPARWHAGIFPTTLADRTVLLAGALGAPFAWRRRPLWLATAAVGLAFLLAWPTRWPQYTLLVRPALAVCAGAGLEALIAAAVRRWPW